MAQESDRAFGVGEDNKHINTVGADGVALSAIRGLYEIVREKEAEIAHLKAVLEEQNRRNAEVRELLERLESRLTVLADEKTDQ